MFIFISYIGFILIMRDGYGLIEFIPYEIPHDETCLTANMVNTIEARVVGIRC